MNLHNHHKHRLIHKRPIKEDGGGAIGTRVVAEEDIEVEEGGQGAPIEGGNFIPNELHQ